MIEWQNFSLHQMRSSFPSQMCDGWETEWSFFVGEVSKKRSHSVKSSSNSLTVTSLCCVQLSVINDFTCSTSVTTCQDPGSDTDSNAANIDNWLQQVTEKNGPKQGKKIYKYKKYKP